MGSVRASAFGGSNAPNTISTATLTPALGDLWVVIATQTGGSTSGASVTDTNADPGGSPYVKIDEQTFTGGVMSIWVRQGFITSNTTSTDAIYSPGSGSTANELAVVAVSGMRATGASIVRQHGHNNGAAAVTPSGVLGSVALTTSVMIMGLANTTNPAGVTGPGWSLLGNVGQAKPLGLEVHSKDNGFTASSINYGGTSATDWATLLLELSATAVDAVDMGTPGGPFVYTRRRESALGAFQSTGFTPPRENPMMTFPVKQNTAVTIPVFMRTSTDGSGLPGLTLAVQSKKYGAAFASISPTQTDRGNGWYDLAFTSGMVDTLGPMPLHITAGGAYSNDENIIDVVAIDKQDAVRAGLSALPNAAAGANTGLPVQGGAIPNATAGQAGGLAIGVTRGATAQGAGTGNNQIQLDAGASATDGLYNRQVLVITSGTGAGQARRIIAYTGSTKVATVNRDWKTNPDNTSVFEIIPDSSPMVAEGLAQGGGANTITLASTESSTTDFFKGVWIEVTSGTGAGQVRLCTAYNGTSKAATVDQNWAVAPDSTSGYAVLTGASIGGVSGTVSGTVTVGAYASGQNPGGTLKPNCVIDNYTYDANKNPTAWRVRVFASSAAADTAYAAINTGTGQGNADGTDGEIEREKYTAEYNVNKQLIGLKRHKEL